MRTTKHGEDRIRKRVGINKKAVKRLQDIALTKGVTHKDCIGSLHRYVTFLWHQNKAATNIRLYADYVWIFTDLSLVTVFPMPNKYKRHASNIQKMVANGG